MSSRTVIPIRDIERRLPEQGRIKIGVKTAKAMKAIDTFRFHSQDHEAIREIAAAWGGEATPMNDPKSEPNQMQVTTTVNEIPIALPPPPFDPLGNTPMYEHRTGGGRQRWCDGITCETFERGPEGLEMVECPCKCEAEGRLTCKMLMHVSVFLPSIRGGGMWRLTTKSQNAVKEAPAMVDAVRQMQSRGIMAGVLRIQKRTQVVAGETHKFVVPMILPGMSLDEIAAGGAQIASLPSGAQQIGPAAVGSPSPPSLGRGSGGTGQSDSVVNPDANGTSVAGNAPGPADLDDTVIEAEIVEDRAGSPNERGEGEPASDRRDDRGTDVRGSQQPEGAPSSDPPELWTKRNAKAQALVVECWPEDNAGQRQAARKRVIGWLTEGRTDSSRELDDDEWTTLFATLETIASGRDELHLSANGDWTVRRRMGGGPSAVADWPVRLRAALTNVPGVGEAKALMRARKIAGELSVDAPTLFDEIDGAVAERLLAEYEGMA